MLTASQYAATESFSEAKNVVMNLFEKDFVILRLAQCGGNVSAAARASGMTRQNFQRLMKKHTITAKEYRP